MTDITTKAFEDPKKKISYDISVRMLEMIDELAKISFVTRAQILDAIIFPGTRNQVDFMIKTWKELIKDERYKGKPQERIKKVIEDAEKFQDKWKLKEYPSELKKAINKAKKN